MTYTLFLYLFYLLLSISLTVWVGRTLFRNGHRFLLDIFQGQGELAASVNQLLLVGFYLLNFGYIALSMRTSLQVASPGAMLEVLSVKMGIILLVLGGLHFLNLTVLYRLRKKNLRVSDTKPEMA